jgi:gamma-glutamyl phosphate reductase
LTEEGFKQTGLRRFNGVSRNLLELLLFDTKRFEYLIPHLDQMREVHSPVGDLHLGYLAEMILNPE